MMGGAPVDGIPAHDIEALKRRVAELTALPTLPGVVRFVTSMVEDGSASMQEVGETISKDQVLSAKILRMVNSPFYGFPGRISSVTHALVLLGFSVVKGLVLTTAVFDNLSAQHKGLWEHSLGTAVISRRIARALGMQDCEEIMISGLLHDLGKVVLAVVDPARYDLAVQRAFAERVHISETERAVFGVDHTTVSSWVCDKWHLPPRLVEVLCLHHAPRFAKQNIEAVAIVHVADVFARAMGYGNPGDPTLPPFEAGAFSGLGLDIGRYDAILREAEIDFREGSVLFGMTE